MEPTAGLEADASRSRSSLQSRYLGIGKPAERPCVKRLLFEPQVAGIGAGIGAGSGRSAVVACATTWLAGEQRFGLFCQHTCL